MSLSAITTPASYMAAYSAVPLKVYDPNYNNYSAFKYIVNLIWDKSIISNDIPYSVNNFVYTKLTFTKPHNFQTGDSVLLDDAINSDLNTGYYNVKSIVSSTEITIDLIPSSPFASSGATIGKVIKYNISPDLDGYGKVDLSNILKDFVSFDITGQTTNYSSVYEGDNTRFCYELWCGEEFNYSLSFDDNLFSGGSVGFYASGITSLSGVPFQVGDQILIQQDIVEWPYTDNFFQLGSVGFTGNTNHSFLVGQQVNVTGQQTFPFYNGVSTILSATSKSLVIDKAFQGSTPVEPGKIYGTPRPEYNTTAVITQIFIDPTYGLVIITNIPYTTGSVKIPGTISYANGQVYTQPKIIEITNKCVFNARLTLEEYSINGFLPYVVTAGTSSNISTILSPSNCYRVEENTIGFLLTHNTTTGITDGLFFTFFNSSGTQLGTIRVPQNSYLDYYTPFGLNQLSQTNYTNVSGVFSGYSGNVSTYKTYAYDSGTKRTNELCFFINPDCSKYEIYHLCWVDKMGSIISMPFIYVSRDNIEVQRKNYYQEEGNWNNNTFGYNNYDRGEKSFYTQSRKSLILNSGFLKDYETDLIEDMMQSISVWVQTPQNKLFAAQLAIDSVELYKNINEQIFSYTMNVRFASNEVRF